MKLNPIDNCRNFVSSRPPLVVFLVCVGMIAVAFVSYAYYIKYHDVDNPDVLHDYNTFLRNVTKLDLCMEDLVIKPPPSVTNILSNKDNEYRKISFEMKVYVTVNPNTIAQNVTGFVSVLRADMLGVKGALENSTVAVEFQPLTESVALSCDLKASCIYNIKTCATITALPGVFPNTPVPSTCSPQTIATNITNPLIMSLEALKPKTSILNTVVSKCKSKIYLKAVHSYERKLTVLLTLERRTTVNMHLMHSSYLLFVIIITILLFGIIVGGKEKRIKTHYSAVHSSSGV